MHILVFSDVGRKLEKWNSQKVIRALTFRRREKLDNSCYFKILGIYILLIKREGGTGRISARGLDSADRAQNQLGPIFSQYGPEQA